MRIPRIIFDDKPTDIGQEYYRYKLKTDLKY